MPELNRVLLIGNLVRDPEMRTVSENIAICGLRLAVGRQYTDREGNQKDEVSFVDVDAFRTQAENCGKYLHKGSSVLVEGRLKMDAWEDRATGKHVTKLKVIADAVHFLGAPRGQGEAAGSADRQGAAGNNRGTSPSAAPQSRAPASRPVQAGATHRAA